MAGTGTRVLVVDDSAELRSLVRMVLERDGYVVEEASDGAVALDALRTRSLPDLAILDLAMPGVGGAEVLPTLHQLGVPVIILTGHGGPATEVWGLEAGADDFLTKPVAVPQLLARVHSVLRRTVGAVPERLAFHGLAIDVPGRRTCVQDHPVDLTAREFDVLLELARHPGEVLTREQLLRSVWASEPGWQDLGTVAEHVYRVRKKLADDPAAPRWIETVRGVGYRFVGERHQQRLN